MTNLLAFAASKSLPRTPEKKERANLTLRALVWLVSLDLKQNTLFSSDSNMKAKAV
jgi:hypothetical protein